MTQTNERARDPITKMLEDMIRKSIINIFDNHIEAIEAHTQKTGKEPKEDIERLVLEHMERVMFIMLDAPTYPAKYSDRMKLFTRDCLTNVYANYTLEKTQ